MIKPLTATWKFVHAERSTGVSFKKDKEKGIPYDFAQVRVSDDVDAFNIDVEPTLVEQMNNELTRGDYVEFEYLVGERYRQTQYKVVKYKKVNQFAKTS